MTHVIIRLLFILAQIPSFMRRLNILKLIVILFEKKIIYRDIKTEFVNNKFICTKIDYICNKLGTYNLYASA